MCSCHLGAFFDLCKYRVSPMKKNIRAALVFRFTFAILTSMNAIELRMGSSEGALPEGDQPEDARHSHRTANASEVETRPVERAPTRAALALDRAALALGRARDRLAVPLARAAHGFIDRRGWFEFGYARLEDHARERFSRSGRWVRDLAALAVAFEALPLLKDATSGTDGEKPLGRVMALMIGRVADAASVSHWIALARSSTVRELREAIRHSRDAETQAATGNGLPHGDGVSQSSESVLNETPGDSHVAESPDDEEESIEKVRVKFRAPAPMVAAFDEARDLFSAVSGGAAGLSDFIEALVAEAAASVEPPEFIESDVVTREAGLAEREQDLARITNRWSFLNRLAEDLHIFNEASSTLEEVDRLCTEAAEETADADALIRRLVQVEDEIELRLGQVLAEISDIRGWKAISFSGAGHYGEERLGVSRATAENRHRLARALRHLPTVRDAYETGLIGTEAATLVARALGRGGSDVHSESAWVEHARDATVKRLRDEILMLGRDAAAGVGQFGQRIGDSTLTTETEPVQWNNRADDNAGHHSSMSSRKILPPTDEAWRASISRRAGQSIDRLRTFGLSAARRPFSDSILRFSLPTALAVDLTCAVGSRVRLLERIVTSGNVAHSAPMTTSVAIRIERQPDTAGTTPVARFLAEMFSTQIGFIPDWVGLYALLEEFVATWDDPRQSPKREGDKIYIRDGWRCAAPGCTSRRNLEDHHVTYRSRGGSNRPSNRVTLCRFHHQRGEHGGLLRCRGSAPLGLRWRLGIGGKGGLFVNERQSCA